jgi:hypothetical protein
MLQKLGCIEPLYLIYHLKLLQKSNNVNKMLKNKKARLQKAGFLSLILCETKKITIN